MGIVSAINRAETPEPEPYRFVSGEAGSDNRILKVDVEGVILGSGSGEDGFGFELNGVTYGYRIQEQLQEAAKDDRIKAVLIHFSTPGGTIYGSQAIYDGIRAYQKTTNKPVYAYIEGISASGGVWAMVGADKIYADHGSLVGSIGILGPNLQYFNNPKAIDGGLLGGGVVTESGIENIVITAGRGKDLGNPFRRPTAEELKVLQAGVNTEYTNFVQHVAKARGIPETKIRNQMGAMLFDNKTAQTLGLIDGTQGQLGVLTALATQAKLGDDYQLVRFKPHSVSLFGQLLGAKAPPAQSLVQQRINQDLCAMTQQRILVYHGNPQPLCSLPGGR
jgi:protease-4